MNALVPYIPPIVVQQEPEKVPPSITSDVFTAQFDRLVGPILKCARLDVDRRLLVSAASNQKFFLSGNEIAALLLQVRAAIPEIAALPNGEREHYEIPITFLDGRKFFVRAGAIPQQFKRLYEFYGINANRIEHQDDEFELLSMGDVLDISRGRRGKFDLLSKQIKALVFDPCNPEKGQKYVHTLFSMREALNRNHPKWELILPKLEELSKYNDFAKHAYFSLAALSQNEDCEADIRRQYAFIIDHLREALMLVQKSPNSVDINHPDIRAAFEMLKYVCHAKFTMVYMYPWLEDIISKVLRAPTVKGGGYEIPEFDLTRFADDVAEANHKLHIVPPEYQQMLAAMEWKKFQGTVGFGFDPTAASNTPWVHSEQRARVSNQQVVCTILRHGTPTMDPTAAGAFVRFFTGATSTLVVPEYRAHLAAAPNKQTLYVNHQGFGDPNDWYWPAMRAEVDRSRAIRGLEEDFSNFHFLSLPMDGEVWKVKNKSTSELKKFLIDSFINEKNGFAFPKLAHADIKELVLKLEEILHNIHQLYFKNGEIASEEDKYAFIMLFYSEVKDLFKAKLGIHYIVSSCKDNKDRGNASTNVDMMKNLVKLGQENDPACLREVFYSVLAPFVIKNEAIIDSRLKQFLCVVRVLARLTAEQKEAIRKISATGYHVTSQEVPRERVSWSSMVSSKQFGALIENMQQLREKRVIIDRDFQRSVVSDYLKGGRWELGRLRVQLQKDMDTINIQLNGKRMRSFDSLCQEMEIDPRLFDNDCLDIQLTEIQRLKLRFMSMLQRGTAIEMMRDPAAYLNHNRASYAVSQRGLSPERARVQEIILTAEKNIQQAVEMVEKSKQEFKNGLFERYLFSAVESRFLPLEFQPKGNFETIPVYPTVIMGTTKGVLEVEAYQELSLASPEPIAPAYPISVRMSMKQGNPAKIAWEFNP